MKRLFALSLLALAFWPGHSRAFDGNRQGFVLGIGLGVTPAASWSSRVESERKVGFGMHAVAGYGWDQSNILAFETNGTVYHGRLNTDSLIGPGSLTTSQQFDGAAWYHYYGRTGRSPFTVAGLGIYRFDPRPGYQSDPGAGYLVGAGYGVLPHVQAGLCFSGGRTFQHARGFEPARGLSHNHLNVLFSLLGY